MKFADLEYDVVRNINKDMPIQTDTFSKLPMGKFELPKNWDKEFEYKHNKYLNNHLAEIEEAIHCKILSPLFIQAFLHQNRKYHIKSGILNHDNFFRRGPTFYNKLPNIFNVGLVGSLKSVCTPGADLTAGSDSATNSGSLDNALASKLTAATVGQCYDQIKVRQDSGSGFNYNLAFYDDTGSDVPNDKLGETGSQVGANTTFVFKPLTAEVEVTTVQMWAAHIASSNSWTFRSASGVGDRSGDVRGTFSFADPWVEAFTDNGPTEMAVGHT